MDDVLRIAEENRQYILLISAVLVLFKMVRFFGGKGSKEGGLRYFITFLVAVGAALWFFAGNGLQLVTDVLDNGADLITENIDSINLGGEEEPTS